MMKKNILFSMVILISSCCSLTKGERQVREYITSSWDRTVRYNPQDSGSLFGLPFRYTVPSPEGMFQEMYYWDTYFTNEGLIADGRIDLAKGNTMNLLSLANRFGFVPNGSRTWYLSRSQPPFLSLMVKSVYDSTKDEVWLKDAYRVLKKEYDFWQTRRMTQCGLNRYAGTGADQALVDEFVVTGGKRLGKDFNALGMTAEEHEKLGRDFTAEAESGWDFNPRFERVCGDFCPVDLNALMYSFEKNMESFSGIIGAGEEDRWASAAEKRRVLIDSLLYDSERRIFFDYNYVTGRRSDIVSAAAFVPLFCGLASEEQAAGIRDAIKKLEYKYGLSVCEQRDYGYDYQWSFPNTWPPTTFMAVFGLDRYGYRSDALRIAEKYLRLVVKSYRRTGTIWEKYDVVSGLKSEGEEYQTPEMLGWSAGTFICLSEYCKRNNHIL